MQSVISNTGVTTNGFQRLSEPMCTFPLEGVKNLQFKLKLDTEERTEDPKTGVSVLVVPSENSVTSFLQFFEAIEKQTKADNKPSEKSESKLITVCEQNPDPQESANNSPTNAALKKKKKIVSEQQEAIISTKYRRHTYSEMIAAAIKAHDGAATGREIIDYVSHNFSEELKSKGTTTWTNSLFGTLSANRDGIYCRVEQSQGPPKWQIKGLISPSSPPVVAPNSNTTNGSNHSDRRTFKQQKRISTSNQSTSKLTYNKRKRCCDDNEAYRSGDDEDRSDLGQSPLSSSSVEAPKRRKVDNKNKTSDQDFGGHHPDSEHNANGLKFENAVDEFAYLKDESGSLPPPPKQSLSYCYMVIKALEHFKRPASAAEIHKYLKEHFAVQLLYKAKTWRNSVLSLLSVNRRKIFVRGIVQDGRKYVWSLQSTVQNSLESAMEEDLDEEEPVMGENKDRHATTIKKQEDKRAPSPSNLNTLNTAGSTTSTTIPTATQTKMSCVNNETQTTPTTNALHINLSPEEKKLAEVFVGFIVQASEKQ